MVERKKKSDSDDEEGLSTGAKLGIFALAVGAVGAAALVSHGT